MKRVISILPLLIFTLSLLAQVPNKMSYQAVIRNSDDELVVNQEIVMQISILKDKSSGSAVYAETQYVKTNANGLVSLEIGTGTTSDIFAEIDWSTGAYFIKTETDPYGGNEFTLTSTTQLLSVPYAMHAGSVDGAEETVIIPQSTYQGNALTVSFSGGRGITFSGSTPVALRIEEATRLYPKDIYIFNDKRMDAFFKIPYSAGSMTYDVVINPYSQDSVVLEKAFKVFSW